jgi:hypothetical protein
MCKHRLATDKQLELDQAKTVLEDFDYIHFCGVSNYNDKSVELKVLDESTQRVTCEAYRQLLTDSSSNHLLIDVRPPCQFRICSLNNSLSNHFFFLISNFDV